MEPWRWIRGAVPIGMMALVGAWGLTRPPLLAAADPVWQPPPCTDAAPPGVPSAARAAVPSAARAAAPAAARAAAPAWYRLDGVLDASGTLSGQRLRLG